MKKMFVVLCLCASTFVHASTNQYTVNLDLTIKKDSLEIQKSTGNVYAQMAGTRYFSSIYRLTTTNTPMAKGSVGNLGWCYMRNVATSGTVAVSFDCGVTTNLYFLAAEAALFRLAPSFEITNIHAAVLSGTGDFECTVGEQ